MVIQTASREGSKPKASGPDLLTTFRESRVVAPVVAAAMALAGLWTSSVGAQSPDAAGPQHAGHGPHGPSGAEPAALHHQRADLSPLSAPDDAGLAAASAGTGHAAARPPGGPRSAAGPAADPGADLHALSDLPAPGTVHGLDMVAYDPARQGASGFAPGQADLGLTDPYGAAHLAAPSAYHHASTSGTGATTGTGPGTAAHGLISSLESALTAAHVTAKPFLDLAIGDVVNATALDALNRGADPLAALHGLGQGFEAYLAHALSNPQSDLAHILAHTSAASAAALASADAASLFDPAALVDHGAALSIHPLGADLPPSI